MQMNVGKINLRVKTNTWGSQILETDREADKEIENNREKFKH